MVSDHDKSSLTQKNSAVCEVRTDTEETIVIDINCVLPVTYELFSKRQMIINNRA
jgi:hypothetical protein